eukprot:maker-scaffold_3-snap-gene-20.33-mRNA-1 protein AED:0.00 eAED:0.00 QI:113/1/1/1/1/1/2/45/271
MADSVRAIVKETYQASDAEQISSQKASSILVLGDYGDGWCEVIDPKTNLKGLFPTAYLEFPNGLAKIISEEEIPPVQVNDSPAGKTLLQHNLNQLNNEADSMWDNFDSISVRQNQNQLGSSGNHPSQIPNFTDMHQNFQQTGNEELEKAKREITQLKNQLDVYKSMESKVKQEIKEKIKSYISPFVLKMQKVEAENQRLLNEINALRSQIDSQSTITANAHNLRSYNSTATGISRRSRPPAPGLQGQQASAVQHQKKNSLGVSDPFAELGF